MLTLTRLHEVSQTIMAQDPHTLVDPIDAAVNIVEYARFVVDQTGGVSDIPDTFAVQVGDRTLVLRGSTMIPPGIVGAAL